MRGIRSEFPGVIQAAGLSSRMGELGPKLLLPFRGRPLLAHVVDSALASRLSEVVVVLGAFADRLRAVLPLDARVRCVVNANYALGRSESIRAGLAAITQSASGAPGALFLLGDQPLMSAALIDAVLDAAEHEEARGPAGAPLVAAAGRDTRDARSAKGNPVLFRRLLFEELFALLGDRGALDLISTHWRNAARVPIEDAATQIRIETPDDYRRLLAMERDAPWEDSPA